MSAMSPLPTDRTARRRPARPAAVAAVAAGLVALVVVAAAAPWLYGRWYRDRIFPGVRAAGVELGGLRTKEAQHRLIQMLPGLFGAHVMMRDPESGRTWRFAPADLGLNADASALASAAMHVGRGDEGYVADFLDRVDVRRHGIDVLATEAGVDEAKARRTLADLAPEVNLAPRDAAIRRSGDTVLAIPSTTGHALDVEATLEALARFARRPVTDTLDVVLAGTAAAVFDVTDVAEAYSLITSAPVTMTWREGQVFRIERDRLKAWSRIEDVRNESGVDVPSIVIDHAAIRAWLAPLAATIDHPARDARYTIDPRTGRFVALDAGAPAVALDVDTSVEAVIRAAYTDQRAGELAARVTAATVPGDLAGEINATALAVYQVTTHFAGSPPGRVANLLVATDRFNGVTLAPGQVFSFNRYLGPVTREAGFDATGVGNPAAGAFDSEASIAQVATTAFRAAFWAGLPIVERHAPPSRVGWLEPPVGLDAGVRPPDLDLSFVNDTEGYLVIQSEIDVAAGVLRWVLYATPTERRVTLIGPRVTDITPAATTGPGGAPGAAAGIRVSWAREGARSVVERRVEAEGAPVRQDVFESAYRPAADVFVTGAGR